MTNQVLVNCGFNTNFFSNLEESINMIKASRKHKGCNSVNSFNTNEDDQKTSCEENKEGLKSDINCKSDNQRNKFKIFNYHMEHVCSLPHCRLKFKSSKALKSHFETHLKEMKYYEYNVLFDKLINEVFDDDISVELKSLLDFGNWRKCKQ